MSNKPQHIIRFRKNLWTRTTTVTTVETATTTVEIKILIISHRPNNESPNSIQKEKTKKLIKDLGGYM